MSLVARKIEEKRKMTGGRKLNLSIDFISYILSLVSEKPEEKNEMRIKAKKLLCLCREIGAQSRSAAFDG